jgi:16S rRNA (guanine966-N2)-methyltransferase
MKIIGGELRGKKLASISGDKTRPTLSKTREAIFNIVLHKIWSQTFPDISFKQANVLDVFAGTGALGIEALSRGAQKATFIEKDPDAFSKLQENVSHPFLQNKSNLLKKNALSAPAPNNKDEDNPCHLILMDPPYNCNLVEKALLSLINSGWISKKEDTQIHKTICVAEMSAEENIPDKAIQDIQAMCNFEIIEERAYGKTKIVFMLFY